MLRVHRAQLVFRACKVPKALPVPLVSKVLKAHRDRLELQVSKVLRVPKALLVWLEFKAHKVLKVRKDQ